MLYNYIEDNFTIERATFIMYSLDLLAKYNIPDVEDKLSEVAFYREDLETSGRIGEINSLILEELTAVLALHDIITLDLTDDLALIYNMTDTLKKVSEEYDADYILGRVDFTLTDANEVVDVFANLVELVTDSTATEVLDAIYSIDEAIVNNIYNLLDSKRGDYTQLTDNNASVERYKRFLKGRRYGLVYELVVANVEVGKIDFNNLFLLVEDALDALAKDDLLFEIISLILISNVEDEDLPALFDKASRLMGSTVAESKLLLSELKRNYMNNAGTTL